MAIKKYVFVAAGLLICHHGHAARNDNNTPFSDVFMSVGTNGQKNPMGTLDNFRRLAPGSPLLNQIILTKPFNPNEKSDGNLYLLGFGFKRKSESKGPQFRFAFGYGRATTMEGEYSNSNIYRFDTLTSSRTGEKIYIDSTVYEHYKFRHEADILTLDISLVWRSSNKHKMKLFGGIGASYGASSNGKTDITYQKYSTINYYPRSRYIANQSASETYETKSQVFGSVYFPFGLDYQLSKKSSFWKNLHLFLESRAQLYYKDIPELGETIQGRLQLGIGVRVILNQND